MPPALTGDGTGRKACRRSRDSGAPAHRDPGQARNRPPVDRRAVLPSRLPGCRLGRSVARIRPYRGSPSGGGLRGAAAAPT